MSYDFSLDACKKSVVFSVETLHENPLAELGRAFARAQQDPFYNKTMIEAWQWYIKEHDIRWDD